jgi:DNA-binding NtrC family response regulator
MLKRALTKEGYKVESASGPKGLIEKISSSYPDLVLLDIHLPGKSGIEILKELKEKGVSSQVVMLTADDTAESAIKAMKLGAVDYLTKPFEMAEVKIVVRNILEKERLKEEVDYLRRLSSDIFMKEIIGESEGIAALKEKIGKLSEAGIETVLVTGESGTGKELLARYFHTAMFEVPEGVKAPFVAVNCAAIPDNLIESELFGYVKGAFTDAQADKKGLFEIASGGTILLDEIGEMKLDLQSKLLRVLEERKVRRVGGKDDIPIKVSVVATTNRDLAKGVEDGVFRMDLFYRLNTFSLHVLPIRERREDILPLSSHFLQLFAKRYSKKIVPEFSGETEKLLYAYEWPGNVRELKNVMERIVVLESSEIIRPEHLPREIVGGKMPEGGEGGITTFVLPEEGVDVEDVEKGLIEQALNRSGNNRAKAARLLNMTYDTLRYKIKKYKL